MEKQTLVFRLTSGSVMVVAAMNLIGDEFWRI